MNYFKIAYYVLINKLLIVLICVGIGVSVHYLFGSTAYSVTIPLAFFFIVYFWFIGPAHYVTKERLKQLINKGVVSDCGISQFDESILNINIKQKKWTTGAGVLDRISNDYCTNYSLKELFFYTREIPYLNLFAIQWKNVIDICKAQAFADEYAHREIQNTYRITLRSKDVVYLPLGEGAVSIWKQVLNRSGQSLPAQE